MSCDRFDKWFEISEYVDLSCLYPDSRQSWRERDEQQQRFIQLSFQLCQEHHHHLSHNVRLIWSFKIGLCRRYCAVTLVVICLSFSEELAMTAKWLRADGIIIQGRNLTSVSTIALFTTDHVHYVLYYCQYHIFCFKLKKCPQFNIHKYILCIFTAAFVLQMAFPQSCDWTWINHHNALVAECG